MSVFAPYMQKFVDAKEALGFSRKYFESVLGLLDRFFIEEKVRTPFITRDKIAINCVTLPTLKS